MGEFLIYIVLLLTQVPKAFNDSLAHCKQPQYLTVISIRIVKLTNQKDLDVSKRCFTDDCCNMFGLLTNSPLPAVSIYLPTVFGIRGNRTKSKTGSSAFYSADTHYKSKGEVERWRRDKNGPRRLGWDSDDRLITLRCALCCTKQFELLCLLMQTFHVWLTFKGVTFPMIFVKQYTKFYCAAHL